MCNPQTGDFARAKPRPLMIFGLISAMWGLLFGASPVTAADAPARIESVHVGFRGVVEVGRWSPISVRVTGTAGTEITLRVTSADSEGRPVRQSGTPVAMSATSTVLSLVYQHGPIKSPVVVELLNGNEVITQLTLRHGAEGGGLHTVSQLTDFVLCLGEPVLGFAHAAEIAQEIRQSRPDRVAPLLVQHYSPEQLPELPPDPRGWEAVDVIVISSRCEIPDALGQQLKEWVRQGGRVVLTGGEAAISANSPGLNTWLPIKPDGGITHHDITSLNASIPGSATLRLREGSLRTVRWVSESGAILTRSQDGPLVIRAGESLGTVTAIAMDLNDLPFVRVTGERQSLVWESLPDLCRWLAGLPLIPTVVEDSQRPQSDLNPTGVSDLQTQLVNTLDQFPEVIRPSYWVVLGSTLLFLLIVGPLDYWLVHRLLKRPQWTWLSLPVWILLGGLVGLSVANRTGGTQVLTRQLDLVTWDATEGAARLDSWLAIYSPEHHRYEVNCVPGPMNSAAASNAHLRWAGRPEAGFRGLYRETDIVGGAPLEFAPEGRGVIALPIRHGASSVVEAKTRWEQQLPVNTALYDEGDGHLKGTFSHQLEGELLDWVLVYGSFAYLPPRNDAGIEIAWRAGETLRADRIPSRLVADYLVRMSTRSVSRRDGNTLDYSMSRQAYDPLSREMLTLLQTVSFNQLAGGTSYTGLTNSTLQTEDLSRLVDAHRAVVFGRWRNSAYQDAETPVMDGVTEPLAAQYSLDGQPVTPRYRECFVRWVLPVKQAADSSTRP